MEEKICLILRDLGMLSRFTGYKYLKDAILLELECEGSLEHITKDIYPELAKRYHASIWMIETDIRNMISRCWGKARPEKVEKYFPGMVGKKRPTNTQFIEQVIKYIKTHDEE